jgi:predicted transcriptional regulator
MPSTPFSIWLTDELKESLAVISQLTHPSQSQLAAKAIAENVSRNEWKLKAIQAAKVEANKGVFVSQNATLNWLDSWGTDYEQNAPEPDIPTKLLCNLFYYRTLVALHHREQRNLY